METQTAEQQRLDTVELAARIGNGDRRAEAELARHFGPKIEFILRRRVRDHALAADLRQETLIVVIQRLRGDGIEQPEKLAAFIHRTATHLALNQARTYYRRNTHPDSDALEAAATSEPLAAELIDRQQLADAIRDLLGELRQPRDRQLLRRFYLLEEDKADICRSLEVTSEHFDRILYRARKRFREILERRLGRDLFSD
ncbi:MAG: sigma-70 family RNA polymerase sigma factor [Wenzhouxiangellaceae bacterium]